MANTTIPTISFINDLDVDVLVYDSFVPTDETPDEDNYFGRLTKLGTAAAKGTTVIQPIHSSTTFILDNATDTKPVKRCVKKSYHTEITSFNIEQADQESMAATFKFIDFITKNPDDQMTKDFNTIISSEGLPATDVNAFFAKYPEYAACVYEDYMMGITYIAKNPPPPPPPNTPAPPPVAPEKATYALSKLVKGMGGNWPAGLPDITVSNFTCSTKNNVLDIYADIDITMLPFETPTIASNIKSLFSVTVVKVNIMFNYQVSAGIFGTRLKLLFDDFNIPTGSSSISVDKPTVIVDINPLFKFVALTIEATFPFDMEGKTFDALASFVIDNDEAAIGIDIQGDNTFLPAPPGIKGLHFDEFGVGMGLFFKPPGFTLGIQGKFHIGEQANGNIVSLNDETFALVCEYIGEVIKPKYASFYIPKLDLNTVVELFTDADLKIDVPVHFSDLSFHWSDGLMSSVVLPDGTLSPGGYGFSAAVDIFSFGFYGDVNLDLNAGLTANVEVSPINWKNIFQLTGDGKGFSMKYDQNGNPIRNNFIPKTQAEKDAVASATDRQIVSPGGANLIINTLSMPILHLNAKASLFDLVEYDVTADINKDGIKFELDFGAVITEKMVCNLSDFHNFYGSFGYCIDKSIPLTNIDGVSLGSIPLKTDMDVHLSITTSTSDVVIKVGGQFDFESYHYTFGDFTADINISKISDFLEAIGQYIKNEAKSIFTHLVDTAEHWAEAAGKGIIAGFDDAGTVMKNAYGKSKEEMVTILKGAGFAADAIAKGLKDGYGAASQEVAALLKQAGYDVTVIGTAIKNAWNCGVDDVSWALHEVGYEAEDVANALVGTFRSKAQEVTNTLKKWGYEVKDIANVIKSDLFKGDSIAVAAIMKQAGYAIDDISTGIKKAWDCTAKDVTYALKAVGYTADEVAASLKTVFNAVSQDVASALKVIGYTANEVAGAIRSAWNCHVSDVVWAMQQVSYEVHEISGAVKSAFGDVAQDLANAFKQFGIGAQDAADAIKNVYGKVINDTASILKQAGYATNDVASALKDAFNTSVNAVADAMKQVGYAADDVKNAFESLGGDFKSFADDVWGDAKHYLNPSNW